MRTSALALRRDAGGVAVRALAAVFLLAIASAYAAAQSESVRDGSTPSALAAGAPAGSYALSDFETVNPYNGGLNFNLPLLKIGGRGGAGYAMAMRIDQKWVIRKEINPGHTASFYPTPTWLDPDGGTIQQVYSVGKLSARYAITRDNNYTLARLTFSAPDGTEYELRDAQTNGTPHYTGSGWASCLSGQYYSRGRVFVTADGTSATFIADPGRDVQDLCGYETDIAPPGYMILKDGTRFRIDTEGRVAWMRDRNGNLVTFAYGYNANSQSVMTVTDSLGRQVTVTSGSPTVIAYKGFGGTDHTVKVNIGALGTALRSDFQLQTQNTLFPGINNPVGTTYCNPAVITSIELPDQRTYQFKYNSYGELARVVLPTGGAFEYDHAAGLTDGVASGMLTDSNNQKQVYRRAVERREYPSGGSGAGYSVKQVYSRPESSTSNAGYVEVRECVSGPSAGTCDSGAALLGRTLHYYYGSPRLSFNKQPVDYTGWQEGREYRTEIYDPQSNALLRKVEHTWQQPVDGQTWPLVTPETNGTVKSNLPLITQTQTTLADTNQVSKQAYAYDRYGNRTDTYEYDYGTVGSGAAGALIRRTHADFVTTPVYVNADVDPSLGAGLRGLPLQQWVSSDAAGANRVTLTSYAYDQYALTDRPGIPGKDAAYTAGFTARGNVTGVTNYLSPGSASGGVTRTLNYDVAGNVVSETDALGQTSYVSYADNYSDGNNARNTYAFPTGNTSPVPDPTGVYGSTYALTSSTVYDFYSGSTVSDTDANGKTTTYEYNDGLGRITKESRPDGGRTTFTYVDTHQCGAYVETRTLIDTSGRETDSYQFHDGFGRPYLTESYDGQDANNVWLRVDTRYDALGRTSQVSNPYRSGGCGAAANPSGRWTTTGYDTLGRAQSVTAPDGAAVTSGYSGTQVTVTDAAGRKRSSVSDALGRLTSVTEDPTAGGFNYVTNYTYDALGNLRKVDQGGQLRYFMYDSLSRLIRVKSPEQAVGSVVSNLTDSVTGNSQWSLAYGYDNNGNLTAKVDARGVTTNYTYDRLNRNTTTTYTLPAGSGVGATPEVRHYYDNAAAGANGLGRLYWSQAVGVSANAFDAYDSMGRPTNYHQVYWVNNAWGQPFYISRSYDKAGNVTGMAYPTGRTVSHTYDGAGRINSFAGNLGDGVPRSYSSGVTYSEFGGIHKEQFGTQTPLYHKLHYNPRGQLYASLLSSVDDEWNWNRGMLVNHYGSGDFQAWGTSGPNNNGNVLRSHHYVPNDDQISGYKVFYQDYEYDSLNRLSKVTESNSITWTAQYVQKYEYDRWGNRTVNAGQTWGAPNTQFELNPQSNQEVSEPSNRLYAPGDSARAPSQKLMRYDAAGNLTYDGHTGQGSRVYDAENRITQAQDTYQGWSTYTYDADGHRVKRLSANQETWQIYGMGGELLAEYRSGSTPLTATKEYGYRGGEMLVTMSSGDDQRLKRFVTNLYYGAYRRDPTAAELQDGMNQLAASGAQGQSQLLQKAKDIARGLFTQTSYETLSPARTDSQYVSDLYYTYLQRGPDDSGLGWWTGNAAGGVTNRSNVCNAFQDSPEFATLVSTLYGVASSDHQRTEQFVTDLYLGAYGRFPDATELQQGRDQLNAAAAQGQDAVKAQAETYARSLFASQVTNLSIPAQQFVTNLYEGFLQRGPDDSGLNWWAAQSGTATGRQNVLDAFATCPPARELSGALYREASWLVADHLGTPRMVVDKSGSLVGVKRHDYLPFGEEVYAGTGGRATAQGYGVVDNLRQKFTGKERDGETGLDYFGARYYASASGRFVSPDKPFMDQNAAYPQSWNLYAYVRNNPLRYVDALGEALIYASPELEAISNALRQASSSYDDALKGFEGDGAPDLTIEYGDAGLDANGVDKATGVTESAILPEGQDGSEYPAKPIKVVPAKLKSATIKIDTSLKGDADESESVLEHEVGHANHARKDPKTYNANAAETKRTKGSTPHDKRPNEVEANRFRNQVKKEKKDYEKKQKEEEKRRKQEEKKKKHESETNVSHFDGGLSRRDAQHA